MVSLPYVQRVLLFGSRAKGYAEERADIDLAIDCPGASEAEWLQLLDLIEEAEMLIPIDCVRLDDIADDEFVQEIRSQHTVLFDREAVQ